MLIANLHYSYQNSFFFSKKLQFDVYLFSYMDIIRCKQQTNNNFKNERIMGFIISCAIYIAVCEGICKMLELEEFNKKAWVYAIVGTVGGFLIKTILS